MLQRSRLDVLHLRIEQPPNQVVMVLLKAKMQAPLLLCFLRLWSFQEMN